MFESQKGYDENQNYEMVQDSVNDDDNNQREFVTPMDVQKSTGNFDPNQVQVYVNNSEKR